MRYWLLLNTSLFIRYERAPLRAFRLAVGLLTLLAVAVQFIWGLSKPNFNPVNFFGFFTILSNTFGAIVLLYASSAMKPPSRNIDLLRGAAVLCLTIVGLVFSILLAKLESDVIPWVNTVVHYITPAAIVFDWLIEPPQTPLRIRDAFWWLALPLAYVCYTLFRGSIVHWYPYPFFNVDNNGYFSVLTYIAGICVFSLVVAFLVIALGNALRAKKLQ